MPESDIQNPERIGHLLRSGFALAVLALLAEIVQSLLVARSAARLALSANLLAVGACLVAAALTYRPQFARRWRATTLVVCVFVIGLTAAGAQRSAAEPLLFVTAIVIVAATGALLPWETGWQAALTAAAVGAAALASAGRHPSPDLGLLWIALVVVCALAMAGNREWMRRRVAERDRPPPDRPTMRKLLGADMEQAAVVELRRGRFFHVNEELVANLSHELRTSLNAILGMTDLLVETPLAPQQRHYVDAVTFSGTTLLDMINVMLDISKVESGRLRLESKAFNLERVIADLVDSLRLRAHEKGLELAVRIQSRVPLNLAGDPLRLRQVLMNLLDNAVKFTSHGEVALGIEIGQIVNQTASLRFSVRDTGLGIYPHKLKTIFQAFTQGDSSVGRDYGGAGLGLAIAQRLVELMGGQIKVESTRGKGSTFSFSALFTVMASQSADLAPPTELRGARVLVVGTNDTNREILGETIADWGGEAVEADGADYAIEELRRARASGKPYKLIMLDCRLPVMDGFEVARRLIGKSGAPAPIVMMLTADDLESKLARLRDLRIDAFVVKPFRRSELRREIEIALGARRVAEPEPAAAPEVEIPAIGRRLRILLADDSPHNRLLIEQYLKGQPCVLDTAENGEVAVDKFSQAPYDLVLMDLRMPVMDGLVATRRIRVREQQENRSPVPVVALSASVLEDDIRDSIEAGCTMHLAKPVKKSQLLALIRQLASAPSALPSDADSAERAPDAASGSA